MYETKTPSGFPWFLSGCSLTLHKPHRRASASQDGNLCLHRTAILNICRECGTSCKWWILCVCTAADYHISSTHRLGPAAVREQRQRATPQYNRTAPSKNTEQLPGLCRAKHTHTEVYFGVFQVKTLLLHIAAHRTRAAKGGTDGPLGRSCSRMRTAPGITVVFYSG